MAKKGGTVDVLCGQKLHKKLQKGHKRELFVLGPIEIPSPLGFKNDIVCDVHKKLQWMSGPTCLFIALLHSPVLQLSKKVQCVMFEMCEICPKRAQKCKQVHKKGPHKIGSGGRGMGQFVLHGVLHSP